MNIFSFSLCLFNLIFLTSNQFIKNNKLKNLENEINIIEIEINPGAEGEVNFINNKFLEKIEKIYVNDKEMTEKNSYTTINANENYTITIQFINNFEGLCENMFSLNENIKKINFKNFNGCSDTKQMFYKCSSLEYLDLSSFNVSNVESMEAMFSGCSSL